MAEQKPADKRPRQSRGKARGRTGPEDMTAALAGLLARTLVPDLSERARQPAVERALRGRHAAEREAGRTAASFEDWVAHTVEQVGAAWILSCLFVRVLEDRGLVDRRRIAGPGALDAQQLFFDIAPSLTERDYLLTVFRELAGFAGVADVLGPAHNPAWRLSPSNDAVRALLALLRQTGPETGPDGALRFGFAGADTRFLGDLYQDLSESVRKRYALLQTPGFVERFILDQTLEPAIAEFGLDAVRVMDPTCGSGHFLLGAFERLVEHRMRTRPGLDRREHARDALAQVFGADVNPYAVAIARFRLTLAYLHAAGIDSLARAPRIESNLVVADSLLHEPEKRQGRLSDVSDDKAAWGDQMFALDDPEAARRILGQRYHAVVGNPPYITCKDKALRDAYREHYASCYREYALAAPFTERFFQLAEERGFVGLINANSFMKREFGKALIEKVLPRYELTRVVDTSGAYIPGHGTPTVLLFGRNQKSVLATVRAVLGKRGEPGTPEDAEQGLVWSSIAGHFDEPGFDDEYISVADMPRETFARHPWSLGGGGALAFKELLEERGASTLGARTESIGFACITKQDDVFSQPEWVLARQGVEPVFTRRFVIGEEIRDWSLSDGNWAVFPYTQDIQTVDADSIPGAIRFMWAYRAVLNDRKVFGGKSYAEVGKPWYEYGQIPADRFRTPLSIAFAFIATHNHFVLDRGGKVFNRSAPIIKLPAAATEDDHLALLAYLNSSTACFWMKQSFFNKGNRGEGGGTTAEEWEKFYEFDGTKLRAIPLPVVQERSILLARLLENAAAARTQALPAAILDRWEQGQSLAPLLDRAQQDCMNLEGQIRWLQEELDWEIYAAFEFADCRAASLPAILDEVPTRALGSRPSDRLFAERTIASGTGRRYFELCQLPASEQVLQLPLPEMDSKRLDLIRANPQLALIEQPTFKRTFREGHRPWDEHAALSKWLLERLEAIFHDAPSSVLTVRQMTGMLTDSRVAEVMARLGRDMNDETFWNELVSRDCVPFLAAQRFTEPGLAKHAQWQESWALQRAEDAGEKVGDIPVPPKYKSTDYAAPGFWRLRGKLDVPRERFIAYPGAEGDDDRSPLVGWAGWDHLQRAQALAALLQQRKDHDGWEAARLVPLLAGLDELVPWLRQWHDQPDPAYDGQRMGALFEDFVRAQARSLGLDLDKDVRAWKPARKQGRGAAPGRSRAARPAAKTVAKIDGASNKKTGARKRASKKAEEA